jgi:hypothetical protein
MVIAIDYDDTFTRDRVTWDLVIHDLNSAGHTIICVSSRKETQDNRRKLRDDLPNRVSAIVLAFDKPKRLAAKEAGFAVDVWIDDRPETIATKEECLALVG